jgi:hypothetical protein
VKETISTNDFICKACQIKEICDETEAFHNNYRNSHLHNNAKELGS